MNDNFTTNRHLGSLDCNKYKGSIDIIINENKFYKSDKILNTPLDQSKK